MCGDGLAPCHSRGGGRRGGEAGRGGCRLRALHPRPARLFWSGGVCGSSPGRVCRLPAGFPAKVFGTGCDDGTRCKGHRTWREPVPRHAGAGPGTCLVAVRAAWARTARPASPAWPAGRPSAGPIGILGWRVPRGLPCASQWGQLHPQAPSGRREHPHVPGCRWGRRPGRLCCAWRPGSRHADGGR